MMAVIMVVVSKGTNDLFPCRSRQRYKPQQTVFESLSGLPHTRRIPPGKSGHGRLQGVGHRHRKGGGTAPGEGTRLLRLLTALGGLEGSLLPNGYGRLMTSGPPRSKGIPTGLGRRDRRVVDGHGRRKRRVRSIPRAITPGGSRRDIPRVFLLRTTCRWRRSG